MKGVLNCCLRLNHNRDLRGVRRVSQHTTTIAQLLRRPKDRMTYEYDIGDGLEHDVILEAILASQLDGLYPIVEAGK